MQGNLITTLLALIFYLVSGIFGGNSPSNNPVSPTYPSGSSQSSLYPYLGSVNTQQASLRNAATANGPIVVTVKQGTQLLVLNSQNNWLQVQTEAGQKGWVPQWMVAAKKGISSNYLGGKIIAGYYVENSSNDSAGYQSLANNLGSINTVIPFSFKVDQYGTISGSHSQRPVSLAKSAGINTLALINNIQGSNFNSNVIHRMLTNASARARAINGITRLVIEKSYRGVNIDFENVPARDRIYLTAFFRELAAALRPKNLLVTASVPAKTYTDLQNSHSGAYDYQALAPYLDLVMIMAYDEHYSNGSPGPVASYPWVEKVINYTLRFFPANKVVLGIAAYGYDWSSYSGKARNYGAIKNLIQKHKVAPKWHSVYKVPYFTYKSWGISHQVWFENSYSTALKAGLAKRYNLRGVAVWRLGYEDPAIWRTLQQAFI